jgi:AraC-like DNA-binding protein
LHHRYVLALALGAGATVYVDDRAIRLNAGEGLLIFPFQFHDYSEPTRDNINWLFVTFDLADGDSQQLLRYRPFVITNSVRQLAVELIEAYLEPSEGELTSLLLGLLLARVRQAPATFQSLNAAPSPPALMLQVNHLVQRRIEIRTVHEIAQSLGISESHLRARFRASCGVSVCQHLRRLRLEKASGLLRLTTNRITEISDQCGFTSIYSFSRTFRDAFGVSPRSYRNDNRQRRQIANEHAVAC